MLYKIILPLFVGEDSKVHFNDLLNGNDRKEKDKILVKIIYPSKKVMLSIAIE